MSHELINHSPDLEKLRKDGYDIVVKSNFLIVYHIPYLSDRGQISYGELITDLEVVNGKTKTPIENHQIHFRGERPHHKDGKPLEIISSYDTIELISGVQKNFSFSIKVDGKRKYKDYYEKVSTYEKILSSAPRSIDSNITAKTHRVRTCEDPPSVHNYSDTNSSRSEISDISEKLNNLKIGIIGMGGTGSYVLDFVSKTTVAEIHIFDKDIFHQHNAFRAPGAATIEDIENPALKVNYFKGRYEHMHNKIIAHETEIDADDLSLLDCLDFIFICIDSGKFKKDLFQYLKNANIPFIDTGIGIVRPEDKLLGHIRTTTFTKDKNNLSVYSKLVSLSDQSSEDDEYSKNIQISELNALNAALAVIKWKKNYGVYLDHLDEIHSVFNIGGNKIENRVIET